MRDIFVVKYRWPIIVLTIFLVMAALIPITGIKINSDLESYFPDSMESKKNDDKIKEIFGNSEPLLVIFEADDILNASVLTRITKLSDEFRQMEEFDNIISIFDIKNIKGEFGVMSVESLVKSIPATYNEREMLRKVVKNNKLAYGLLVSQDFRYTMIMLSSNKRTSDTKLINLINQKLEKYPGNEKVYINGLPYLRSEASDKIGSDIALLLPIGLLLMLIFLWVSFKELRGVLLPFSVVIFSIITSMSLIPLFGWELSIIGVIIPIMMIAIANNYGVHFISEYQELNALYPEKSIKDIVNESVIYLKKPVILCGLTTIVGVLGLIVHILAPASQMGVVSSIGIGFALLLSLTFIPAVMSTLKKGNVHKNFNKEKKGGLIHLLKKTSFYITLNPKRVLYIFLVFLSFSVVGFAKFKVAPDSNKILPLNHPYNKGIEIAERYFGGSKIINLLIEGDIKDPQLLARMEFYESELKKNPDVGSVLSITTILREISKALNEPGDSLYDKIPQTREAVSQYLELYNMSGNPEDFEKFVDFDYTKALITIQFKAKSIDHINIILRNIKELTKKDTNKIIIGGYSLVEKQMSESVVKGQYYSLIFALLAIFILLALIFKSVCAGLLGSLPLIFAVFSTFGLMGWLGIELNIVTALISSISIGLGVDFTIHIFWRLKKELALKQNYKMAVQTTITTIGRGITINALSVILGFSILFFSAFPLIQSFALLIVLSLLLCLLCALLLIPALCIIVKPIFLNSNNL